MPKVFSNYNKARLHVLKIIIWKWVDFSLASLRQCNVTATKGKIYYGLSRDLNPGPLAPKARIIPLDHWASWFESLSYCGSFELCVISNIAEIILCISALHSHISKLRYDYSFILNTHTAEMHSNNNGQDSIPAKITYSELISIFKVTTKAPYLEKIWFWWI